MIEKKYESGRIVFREGDHGYTMYEILSGTADIYTGFGTDKEVKLTSLGEGDIFGELSLIEYCLRSATVVCGEKGAVLREINDQELDVYLRNNPLRMKTIMVNMSHRLRALTKDYLEVCNTIRETKETDEKPAERSGGLLSRISKFLSFSDAEATQETADKELFHAGAPEVAVGKGGFIEHKWKKGQVIFREGDQADCMYYLYAGNVDVYSAYGTEKQKLITTLSEESFFGEMGLIEKLPRSATIVADSDTAAAIVINEKELDRMMTDSQAIVLMAMQHLSSRLRNMTEDYLGACRMLKKMTDAEGKGPGLTEDQMREIDNYISISMMNSYVMLL